LFQIRKKIPFLGTFGPIGGKRKFGETIFETAKRELLEDTGLTGKMNYNGLLDVKVFKGDTIFLHYTMHLIKIINLKGEMKKETDKGKNLWISDKEYFTKKKIIPAVKYHLEIINSKKIRFYELEEYLDKKGKFISAKLINKK
jgi:ADP-ribose pyrophosphatase YjhB (NUDIX family)